MTVRTFWTLCLKFLGLWLVLDFFQVFLQFLSTLFSLNKNSGIEEILVTFFLLLLTIAVYAFILNLFVFKSNFIIDKLKLDKSFNEERIDLNISSKTVYTVAIIFIGGFLIIDSLPNFCKQIFLFFQQKNIFRESPNSGFVIFHFVKTVIGYFLLTNSKFFANIIDLKSNDLENKD